MKKSLCILICFAVVLTACAVGFSAYAGTDALSVVSGPEKLYYTSAGEAIDVTGTKLKVRIDGIEETIELKQNIVRSGSIKDAVTITTTESTTQPTESTTAADSTTTTTTVAPAAKAARASASAANVKVYYDTPLKAGENEVIFRYDDKITSCDVYYDAEPVKSIEVKKLPAKTEYLFHKEEFARGLDLRGLELEITFKDLGDGEETYTYVCETEDSSKLTFMGHKITVKFSFNSYDSESGLKVGDNALSVTYLNKETSFNLHYKEVIRGDVNDDGQVNAKDLVRLNKVVAEKPTKPSDDELSLLWLTSDFNEDDRINTQDIVELRKILTEPDKTGEFDWVYNATLLSYKVSPDGYFYTDDDPWQRNFGFNEVYDIATPYTFMYYDTFRVFFDYGTYEEGELAGVPAGTPKQWMLQPWKGQYGMVLYGAELGVYTKPETRETPHYDCANDKDKQHMAMTVYKDEKEAFTMPYKDHWWITGFKPGALVNYTDMSKPHSQLIIKFTIDFDSPEMAKSFAKGLEERGFDQVGFLDTVNFSKVDVFTLGTGDKAHRVEMLWRDVVGTPGKTNVPNPVPQN
ncbi:MAG: DUF4474 domain-containing protein [Clostridia bacterium]|nr:DUF4474 domain-containing protein [Clostridia bacterium]